MRTKLTEIFLMKDRKRIGAAQTFSGGVDKEYSFGHVMFVGRYIDNFDVEIKTTDCDIEYLTEAPWSKINSMYGEEIQYLKNFFVVNKGCEVVSNDNIMIENIVGKVYANI